MCCLLLDMAGWVLNQSLLFLSSTAAAAMCAMPRFHSLFYFCCCSIYPETTCIFRSVSFALISTLDDSTRLCSHRRCHIVKSNDTENRMCIVSLVEHKISLGDNSVTSGKAHPLLCVICVCVCDKSYATAYRSTEREQEQKMI